MITIKQLKCLPVYVVEMFKFLNIQMFKLFSILMFRFLIHTFTQSIELARRPLSGLLAFTLLRPVNGPAELAFTMA